MNQIWLLLGLKPEGFRSGMKRAVDDTKQFERSWKDLGKIFAAGGITTLALGFLRSMANEAQQTRAELEKLGSPIPAATASLATLGDAFDGLGRLAGLTVGTILSGWQQLFDVGGSLINRLRGISEAQENIRTTAARAADEEERQLAAAREANSPEKIAAALAKLDETRRQSLISRAEGEDKLNLLLAEHVRLTQEASAYGERSIKGAELREKIERNLTQIAQVGAQLDKDKAQAAERTAKEREQAAEKLAREEERLAQAKFAALTAEEQLATLAATEIAHRQQIVALRREGKDTTAVEASLQEVVNDLAARRAALAAEVARAEQAVTEELRRQTQVQETNNRLRDSFLSQLYGLSGRDFASASDLALNEVVRRNQNELSLLRASGNPGSPFDIGDSLTIRRLENEIARITQELDQRRSLRSSLVGGNMTSAIRQFSGDPLFFERLVQQATGSMTKLDETNQLLRGVRDDLQGQTADPALSAAIQRLTQSTTILAGRLGG